MEYTTVAKKEDEYSTKEAAHRLGIHQRTAIAWVKEALVEEESKFKKEEVRQDLVGRYYVKKAAVQRLISTHPVGEI